MIDSLVCEAWSLAGTVQELTRVVAFAPSGSNLTGYILDLATDVEWISEQLSFELAALSPERERLLQAAYLLDSFARKGLQGIVVCDGVCVTRLAVGNQSLPVLMQQVHLEKWQARVFKGTRGVLEITVTNWDFGSE